MESPTSSNLSKSVKVPPPTRRERKHLQIILLFLMLLENFEYIPFAYATWSAVLTSSVDPDGSLLSLAYNRYHYCL
jgi:hypothetical protein